MPVFNNEFVHTSKWEIDNSLRFNDDDSAYLSWTPSVAGNRKTWTVSMWVKLGALDTSRALFFGGDGVAAPYEVGISVNSAYQISTSINGTLSLKTTALYRDPSAWYHIVWAIDTPQATASNRAKLYVNGEQITDVVGSPNYPSQNDSPQLNKEHVEHIIGRYSHASSGKFDGHMSEIHFIDGQALTPSDFGEFDTNYGHWKAKKFSGTHGTNGFYLDFKGGGVFTATGGNTITTDGDYKVHSFTTDGTFTPTGAGYVEYLVIGGGGAGAGGSNALVYGGAGGGGAGGYRTGYLDITGQAYSIVVGDGGTGVNFIAAGRGANGGASSFSTITSGGGGGGCAYGWACVAISSGSGGGGQGKSDGSSWTGGVSAAHGNDGGDGHGTGTTGAPNYGSGGGGGSGAVGADGTTADAGAGGAGLSSSITGTSVTRAGGGGGTTYNGGGTLGAGGSGGGGAGSHTTGGSGTTNTGSGGGAGHDLNAAGSGGSGVVIIRYQFR